MPTLPNTHFATSSQSDQGTGMGIQRMTSAKEGHLVENGSRESCHQLHKLVAWLQGVREEERTRVARQLHDTVLQSLTVFHMDLTWIRSRLSPMPQDVAERLIPTIELVDEALRAVRQLGTELRPGILDLGLGYAIEWQAEAFQALTGVKCIVEISVEDGVWTQHQATAVFRVLQETLASIVTASQTKNVVITLKPDSDWVNLVVQTDGAGWNSVGRPSIALEVSAIRERAASIGGALSVVRRRQAGVTVRLSIPLNGSRQTQPRRINIGRRSLLETVVPAHSDQT
jgi:signal transduction histidine kinase